MQDEVRARSLPYEADQFGCSVAKGYSREAAGMDTESYGRVRTVGSMTPSVSRLLLPFLCDSRYQADDQLPEGRSLF